MQIPIVEERGTRFARQDGIVRNHLRYYRWALYNTLIHLKPKYCLEIGTHTGESTAVFVDYFRKYRPDGKVVTCDIKQYYDIESEHIKQVQVYPHIHEIRSHHKVNEDEMLPDALSDTCVSNSEYLNELKLVSALKQIDKTRSTFDFCFLDGDHKRESLLKDLNIALHLTKEPHYILIDDTEDYGHEAAFTFHREIKWDYCSYEYKDWPEFIGAALIWTKSQ